MKNMCVSRVWNWDAGFACLCTFSHIRFPFIAASAANTYMHMNMYECDMRLSA